MGQQYFPQTHCYSKESPYWFLESLFLRILKNGGCGKIFTPFFFQNFLYYIR